jgi:hypothetical protein
LVEIFMPFSTNNQRNNMAKFFLIFQLLLMIHCVFLPPTSASAVANSHRFSLFKPAAVAKELMDSAAATGPPYGISRIWNHLFRPAAEEPAATEGEKIDDGDNTTKNPGGYEVSW